MNQRFLRGAAVVSLAMPAASSLLSQSPLSGPRSVELAPVFESWRFATTTPDSVKSAQQLSLPIAGSLSLGSSWRLDAYTAYSWGQVVVKEGGRERAIQLNGLTDARLRASARLHGDDLLATFGANVPIGKTELTPGELRAVRVLGAPALRFQTPGLGQGAGGTLGLVGARHLGETTVGAGVSGEYRGRYAPVEAATLGVATLDPGPALRLSVGVDHLVGENRLEISLSSTLYGMERLTRTQGGTTTTLRPGATWTTELHYDLASAWLDEGSLFAYDHYRSNYRNESGRTVAGTTGNELDLGGLALRRVSRTTALLAGFTGRWHTGLKVDETLATAAVLSAGAHLGLAVSAGSMQVRPMIGGEYGTFDSGGRRVNGRRIDVSLAIVAR
ncbi:MAG: hypothetical protein M3068_01290 [Gemmatimonadota bacterium]|nr:hypothetical protein [Gemmatimonadota bacterium]